MNATFDGNEMSANQERNNSGSCNSFLIEAFAFDAMPKRSRSYKTCNRFSSNAFVVVMMMAVYLLLPIGCMAIIAETNQTTVVLQNTPEAEAIFSSSKQQDIDNEISETLDENPISPEKGAGDFLESPLTENLEDTIRSSVKSEIEMEQTVGSPALINAYNIMPQTDKLVLVEYSGASTSTAKPEPPLVHKEPIVDTQCDANSLSCVRSTKKDLPTSTTANVLENIAATTMMPEIDILPSTTLVPVDLESTTILPESDIVEPMELNTRESKTIESENIVQEVEQSPVKETQNIESTLTDITIETAKSGTDDELVEQETANTEEPKILDELNTANAEQPKKLDEPIEEDSIAKALSESLQNTSDDEKNSELNNAINSDETEAKPTIDEIKNTSNEPLQASPEELESIEQKVNITPLQNEIEKSSEAASDISDPVATSAVVSNDVEISKQDEITSPPKEQLLTAVENNSSIDLLNETIHSNLINDLVIDSKEAQEAMSAVSQPNNEKHSALDLSNDTLSIILEEPLAVNETSAEHTDDYVKTIFEMEDPVMDHTTLQPEESMHNVIKKQGVEPIDIEEPIIETDIVEESITVLPISDETTIQPVVNDIPAAIAPASSSPVPVADSIETKAQVSVVFPDKSDDDISLSNKGSRSTNSLDEEKASINFDVYPAGQTFNENLAEESGIGKALPTHRLNEQPSNRSALVIALCSGVAVLFIIVSVTLFLVSYQRQHGTLDIEMQERKDNIIDEDDEETCIKLLDIELPKTNGMELQTDAEAEIEECL